MSKNNIIDLYYWPTPNGWKVSIMLEECEAPYRIVPVNIGSGEQFEENFLSISPNNRMPAIVDHSPEDGPISIFESGAILEYLAEKHGKFLPQNPSEKYKVLQWVHWQMANLGPMMGNANHFKNYAKNLVEDSGQLEYGEKRFTNEVDRLAGVMDAQLSVTTYLGTNDYSIADIVTWPWAFLIGRMFGEEAWEKFPNLKRWVDLVGSRPLVQKGRKIGAELGKQPKSPEEEAKRKEVLFNQTSESIQKARIKALNRTD